MERRTKLRVLLSSFAIAVLIGLVAGVAASRAGGGTWPLVIAVLVGLACTLLASRIRRWYWLPRAYRAGLESLLDRTFAPPSAARPVELALAATWAHAVTHDDWDEATRLLHPEFAGVDTTGRAHGRTAYVLSARMISDCYASVDMRLEAAVAEDTDPDVAWVCFAESARPIRGEPLSATWWEVWTLDPGHESVREARVAGVTAVD